MDNKVCLLRRGISRHNKRYVYYSNECVLC